MDLHAYLNRIDYSQPLRPDRRTLDALVMAQLQAVPFENLDQQMGVDVSTDLERVYDKIVLRRRGGWCFELNGLFAWLLSEIGFEVSKLAGYVGPERPSPEADSDHMLLMVECDGPLLVDVGFGGGPNGPVSLRPCTVAQAPYVISVSDEGDGWYKYSETADESVGSYWFTLDTVETSHFAPENHRLQTDPNSSFRRTLTAQRRLKNSHTALRGRVLKTIDETGTRTRVLPDEGALVECLSNDFRLDVPQISKCWPSVRRRHEELFGTKV